MTRSDLRTRARQHPFRPFRLVLTDGTAYDVRHPDFLMIGRDSAVVGLSGAAEQDFYGRPFWWTCSISSAWNRWKHLNPPAPETGRSERTVGTSALPAPRRDGWHDTTTQ